MASKSRRIPNVNGATKGPLNSVPFVDTSKGFVSAAEKNAQSQHKALVKDVLNAVKQFVVDADKHQLDLDAKLSDIMLGRIASLLDEVREDFVKNELEEVKKEILDEISGISISNVLKNFLLSQVAELFDSDAKKEDIEELKEWMQKNLLVSKNGEKSENESGPQLEDEVVDSDEDVVEDNEKGDYKDSTPAENFFQLQSFIQSQFDQLNENLKNIPGQSGMFSKMKAIISNTVAGIAKKVTSLGKFIAKGTSSLIKGVSGVAGVLKGGAFAAIGGIAAGVVGLTKGIKGIVAGVKGLGSKIGGAIASPFKKIGGFLSGLNPFKKKDKKEEKKQKLKDKIMEKISLVIDKIWKVIEPFIDIVCHFIKIAVVSIILPISLIVAKVLLILAGLVLLAIGAYLAYKLVTAKIKQFWNYIVSGELWEDIKAGMLKTWNWLKDTGKWIGQKLLDFGKWLLKLQLRSIKFIFIDIPVWIGKKLAQFGIWIWKKLKEFGKWLYDNYIDKYIIQPLTRLIQPIANLWVEKIQPIIQPFIDSLTNLKDKIVKAFSSWDTNKSIWENLKNIGGILKNAVIEWWNNDNPFKKVYDEYVQPVIGDIVNFINTVKNAFAQWDTNKSIWENLKNIGGIILDSLSEWWENSAIKKIWDEKISPLIDQLKNYLSDLLKPLIEWYNKSDLKKGVDALIKVIKLYVVAPLKGLSRKVMAFLVQLSNMSINLPTGIQTKKYMGIPIPVGFKWTPFYPLSGIKNKLSKDTIAQAEADASKSPTELINEEMEKMQQSIDDATKVNVEPNVKPADASQIQAAAIQQVQQATQPLKQIENMQSNAQNQIQNDSKEIATEIQQKEKAQQQFDAAQSDKSDAMLCEIRALRKETQDTLKDPYVVPFPVLQNGNYNYAMMENN